MPQYFDLSSCTLLSKEDRHFFAAHVDFIDAYRKRIREQLIAILNAESGNEKRAPSHTKIIDMTSGELEFWEVISKIRNLCWFSPFRKLEIPIGFIENALISYDWTQIFQGIVPTTDYISRCDCRLKLKNLIRINEDIPPADTDEEWCHCPYMLRAANEGLDSTARKIYLKQAPKVTLWIWHALDFLLEHFSGGGDFIDEQTGFEICMYRACLASYNLTFKDKKSSGLDKEARLAGLVELAIYLGFFIQANECRVIVEHDIRVALAAAPAGSRLVVDHHVPILAVF